MNCVISSSPPTLKRVNLIQGTAMSRHSHQGSRGVQENAVVCCVTGSVLDDMCVELRGAYKRSATAGTSPDNRNDEKDAEAADLPHPSPSPALEPSVVVHPDLLHFFNLLWYCCKMEHVVRSIVRYLLACIRVRRYAPWLSVVLS